MVIVAISYRKGVVACIPYEHMDGVFFQSFIDEHFEDIFQRVNKPNTRFVLQDGTLPKIAPNWKQHRHALMRNFFQSPRSPDLNPIENLFKIVGAKLRRGALYDKISKEFYL